MMLARENTDRGVVLALPGSAAAAERLRAGGWTVYRAASGEEARRLACRHLPEAVVLPTDGAVESGWLSCAKLLRAQPRLRVLLVGERSAAELRFARYVGAAELVPPGVGADELAERVEGAVPQAV
jgi:DNA-binding response OmpR family regulator